MTDSDGIPLTLIDRTEEDAHRGRDGFVPVIKYASRVPLPGEIGSIVVDREVSDITVDGAVIGQVRSGGRTIERIVLA